MNLPPDQVTNANFEHENLSSVNNQENLYWISENIAGRSILILGASHLKLALLLAKEGKRVTGIDFYEENLRAVQTALEDQPRTIRDLVTFKEANFMTADFEGQQFDCIIMDGILGQVLDPHVILNKLSKLVNKDGVLIGVLPFGLQDGAEPLNGFYLSRVLKLSTEQLSLTKVKYFGKQIGVVFHPNHPEKLNSQEELLESAEICFEQIERHWLLELQERDKKIKGDTEQIVQEKIEKLKIKQELLEQLDREEVILKQFSLLQRKYHSLSKSKLGRLALYYWRAKRRVLRGK